MTVAQRVPLVRSQIGELRIAVHAREVSTIDPLEEAEQSLDVASWLGSIRPAADQRTRRIRAHGIDLLLGPDILVEHVLADRVQPWPGVLDLLGRSMGLCGIVVEEQGFAWVLDPRVLSLVAEGLDS